MNVVGTLAEARAAQQGARDAHALLFTGGERFRILFFFMQKADLVERRAHTTTGVTSTNTSDDQR